MGANRERFMEEFDTSAQDHENSSDPDVLPRQRAFTRDEMHRLLQDVEHSARNEAAYDQQLMLPASIMLQLQESLSELNVLHNAAAIYVDNGIRVLTEPDALDELYLAKNRGDPEMKRAEDLSVTNAAKLNGVAMNPAEGLAALHSTYAAGSGGAAAAAGSASGAAAGAAGVAAGPASAAASGAALADATAYAETRQRSLTASADFAGLPLETPDAPQDPRLPHGTVARPFKNIFAEAEARARSAGVNGILDPDVLPSALARPTVSELTGENGDFPFRSTADGEKLWAATRPPGMKPEDDPMVRRGRLAAARLADAGLPADLEVATNYREAVHLLGQPRFRGFIEQLSGLDREAQLEKLQALAAIYEHVLFSPVTGVHYEEEARAARRMVEANRRQTSNNPHPDPVAQEEAEIIDPPKEANETMALLRELTKFSRDPTPVEELDPNSDYDYRYGRFSKPAPADFTMKDMSDTMTDVMRHDRFHQYYETPLKTPDNGTEPLAAENTLESFSSLQRTEYRKLARKANDPRFTTVQANSKLRRYRQGLDLYSGIPSHLLDFLHYSSLPADDPRRVTHPLAVKMAEQVGAVRDAIATPEHSAGGAVAAHSDLETGAPFLNGAVPPAVVKATHAARAAREAAANPVEWDAHLDPVTDTDYDPILWQRVEPFLAEGENTLEFPDLETDLEQELQERSRLLPSATGKPIAEDDVRLVDATDGEIEPVNGVSSINPLIAKIYGREARVNRELSAALGTFPASQTAALAQLFALDPAAAKTAVRGAVDRYSVLAAIGSGELQVPKELLLEAGLGSLKALLPPAVDFAAALKATQARAQGSLALTGNAPAAAASASAAAAAPAAGATPIFAVPGSVLAGNGALDGKAVPALVDGLDAVSAATTSAESPTVAFAAALERAAEAVRLDKMRKMLASRGLDSTGAQLAHRRAENAAKAEALNAAAAISALRSRAAAAGGDVLSLLDPLDPRLQAMQVLPYSSGEDSTLERDPGFADRKIVASNVTQPVFEDEDSDNRLEAMPKAELGDNDSLSRTLQDPVEYLQDNLSPTQYRILYNNVERRRENAFHANQLSDDEWMSLYSRSRSRESLMGMDGSETEERELLLMRREITTGALEAMRERKEERHKLNDHDTVIYDNDVDTKADLDEMHMHRISRQLQPYEVLPVTDKGSAPFIAIEQQTHVYNLHKLDPATFHPRWIAKRLNISPNAVVAMLKAQDLIHKTHIHERSSRVGESRNPDPAADSSEDDGRPLPSGPEVDLLDERVLYPRTLDDLQMPYPPETTLSSESTETLLSLDAPHLIGKVSFEEDSFRDPAWGREKYAPVRLIHEADLDKRGGAEREQDQLNRMWAKKEQILDAVERATFAKFGPVHWASGRGTLQRPPKMPREIISPDLQPHARHNWVLTGTEESYRSTFTVSVRDRDGYLRHPTFREFMKVRRRERDQRLPFYWRKHKVVAKLPEVSAMYVDQVLLSLMRTDGVSKHGARVVDIHSEMHQAEERDEVSAAELDVALGIDIGEQMHAVDVVQDETFYTVASESDGGVYSDGDKARA